MDYDKQTIRYMRNKEALNGGIADCGCMHRPKR